MPDILYWCFAVFPLRVPSARWSQKLFVACWCGCGTAKKYVDDVAPSSMTISAWQC